MQSSLNEATAVSAFVTTVAIAIPTSDALAIVARSIRHQLLRGRYSSFRGRIS